MNIEEYGLTPKPVECEEETEEEKEEELPLEPTLDTTEKEFANRFVEYGGRGPNDIVLSGPITGGWGPGRWRQNRGHAYRDLVKRWGKDKVVITRQSAGRWSFLIKGMKNAVAA